jgi:hypothetical protein
MMKPYLNDLAMYWFSSTLAASALALKAVYLAAQGAMHEATPLLMLALALSGTALILEGKWPLPSGAKSNPMA